MSETTCINDAKFYFKIKKIFEEMAEEYKWEMSAEEKEILTMWEWSAWDSHKEKAAYLEWWNE